MFLSVLLGHFMICGVISGTLLPPPGTFFGVFLTWELDGSKSRSRVPKRVTLGVLFGVFRRIGDAL